MLIRKFLKIATLVASGLGVVTTGTVASILVVNSSSDSELFAANQRHYKGEWYNEGALVYENYFVRGQDVNYEGPTPTKVDYTGEKIYIFSGWDTTGDGLPDIPVFKAYSNFKANATYASIDASVLERIDWQKLLEILMDSNIDLEALLARLGLSPEDIAKLLNLNVFTVTSDVTGPAYFRTESFKDYNASGHNWTDADYYPVSNISAGSVNPLQYTSNKLSSLKNNPLIASYCKEGTYEITYNKTGGKYPVIAFETENNQGLPSDSYSLINVGEDKKYTSHGYQLIPCTEETVLAGILAPYSNDAIKNDEKVYREYAKSEYLNISEDYRNYFASLAEQIGATRNNVGQAVTAFTQYLTENFTLEYKHNEFPKNKDPLMYFMNEARVADSNYFATAMTLFLRSLGYPARYTQGYMGAIAEPGVETGVTALQAYSWCEVYVEGVGWMNADGAEYLLVKLFGDYYDLPEEVLDLMDFSNKGSARELESIRIGDNTKFDYIGGTTFSEDDIELIATFDDGYEEKVKPCFVSKPDISDYKSYYDCNVVVLYEYLSSIKSTMYTIHVEPARIEELNVYNSMSYTVVSEVKPEDFYFDGYYNNGQVYDIDQYAVEFEIPEITEPGDYEMEFSFTEYYGGGPDDFKTVTSTFMLHIAPEPVIIDITPTTYLEHEFYTDEGFNLDRDSWLAIRDNGEETHITITDDMILNPEVLDAHEPGNYTLYIQPTDTCEVYEYNFSMVENVLEYIEVYANASTFYRELDSVYDLQPEDITCIAYYTREGDEKEIPFEELSLSTTMFTEAGTYYVDVFYSEEFEYAGLIEVSDTVEINIEDNDIKNMYAYTFMEPYIKKGEEVSDSLFSSYTFEIVRKNGDSFIVAFDDENLSFDFSKVDRFEAGVYHIPVSYTNPASGKTVTSSVVLHILGIKDFEGHFDGVPETLLVNTVYDETDFENWGLYATYTYFDNSGYESYQSVFVGSEGFNIQLDCPFDVAGSYSLVMTYEDCDEIVSDSTIITVIDDGVKEVEFNLSSIPEEYAFNEEFDFSDISATVYYNDDSSETVSYSSGNISVTPVSHGGKPEQVELVFTINVDGEDYSDNTFVEIIRPEGILFDHSYDESVYDIKSDFTNTTIPVYLLLDNGTYQELGSDSPVQVGFEYDPEPGLNTLNAVFVYDDGSQYYAFSDSIDVILYQLELTGKIEDKEYFEGTSFDGEYSAELIYNAGGLYVHENVDVTDEVAINCSDPLSSGENAVFFEYYDYETLTPYYYEGSIYAYELIDIRVDVDEFNREYLRLDDLDDVENIKVYGVYSNGQDEIEKPIGIEYCEISNLETDSLGEEKTAIVSYSSEKGNFTDEFTYKVSEPKIVDVTVDTQYCQTFAYQGVASGIIDISGVQFVVTYENDKVETFGSNDYVTNGQITPVTLLPFNNTTEAGTYYDVYSLTHESRFGTEIFDPLNIEIEIRENNVEKLSLSTLLVDKTFYNAEDFNYDGLKVNAITSAYEDFPKLGSYELNSDEYIVTHDPLVKGENIITVTYVKDPTISATYTVTLKEDEIIMYYASGYDSIVKQGDPIDLSNLEITARYESGKTEQLSSDQFSIIQYPSSAEIGITSFKVQCPTKTCEYQIEVVEDTDIIESIFTNPTSITVEQGKWSDYANAVINDLKVYGRYAESGEKQLDESKYTIDDSKVNVDKVGTYQIKITSTENDKIYTYVTVNVSEPLKVTGISLQQSYVVFVQNQDYDPSGFLDDVGVTISFNLQPSISTTLGSGDYITYYYIIGSSPSTSDVTREPQEIQIGVGVKYGDKYYEDDNEFIVTIYIEVVGE